MSAADDALAAYRQQQAAPVPDTTIPQPPPMEPSPLSPRTAADDALAAYKQQAASKYLENDPTVTHQQGFNDTVMPGSQNKPDLQVPSFLKSLDIYNTAVHRGVTRFTFGIMSKLPLGKEYLDNIKRGDASIEALNNYNKDNYTGHAAQLGELSGEMLATAPLGGLLGKTIGKAVSLGEGEAMLPSAAGVLSKVPVVGNALAGAANSALPSLLQTPAKYALSAAGGIGTNAAIESQRYDPNHPGQMINHEAVNNMLNSPVAMGLSAGLPMFGAAAGTYARNVKKVGEMSDLLGQTAIPRNTMPDGVKKTFYQSIFGFLPALSSSGAQLTEHKNIGDTLWRFISKFADMPEALDFTDINAKAGQVLHATLKQLKQNNQDLWNQPWKTNVVKDTSQVVKDANEAIALIDKFSTSIPRAGSYKTLIENQLEKVGTEKTIMSSILDASGKPMEPTTIPITKQFTVENVKNIQSNIGSAISKIKSEAGSNEITQQLSELHDRMGTHIQNSLSEGEQAALATAKQHSSMLFDLKDTSPLVKEAMVDEYAARKLLEKLRSPKEPIDKQKIYDQIGQAGKNAVVAEKLAEHFRVANESGGLNIDSFLTAVKKDPELGHLMENEAFKRFQGISDYMKNVSEGSKVGWWKPAAVATAIGIPAALSGAGPVVGVAAVVSLGAATFIANHPAFKNLFFAIGKKLPESTKNLIQKSITNHLSRGGFLIGTDGGLRNKNEGAQ